MNQRSLFPLVAVIGATVVAAVVSTGAASAHRTPGQRLLELRGEDTLGVGAASSRRVQVLVLLADATHASTSGPPTTQIGHRQIASGVVRDATGHRLGRFSSTCTWIKIFGTDALEHCIAQGNTPDGQLRFSGPARESAAVHTWRISGGTGRYTDANGTATERDLSTRESLLTVSLTPRPAVVLHSAVAPRPPGNVAFIGDANRACTRAAQRVHSLPPFPLSNFDPKHPTSAQLRTVGAYFTGPGDPRRLLTTLDGALEGLGHPPASGGIWRRLLAARARTLTVINEQDRAALAANVPAFIKTLYESTAAYADVAINSAVFGATACIF